MGDVKINRRSQDFNRVQQDLPRIFQNLSSNRDDNDDNNNEQTLSWLPLLQDLTSVPESTHVNSIEADGNTVILTGDDGRSKDYYPGVELNPEQMYLDPTVLGQPTMNLESVVEIQHSDSTRDLYSSLMKSVGLPVDHNGNLFDEACLNPNLRSATFGCGEFPVADFLTNTLKTLWKTETNLCELHVSWKHRILRTWAAEELNNSLVKLNCGFLVHVWCLPAHKFSVFGMVDVNEFKDNSRNCREDLFDIYVHFSEDEKRISVLSLSNNSLYLNCSRDFGSFSFPAMKAAFTNVTTSDVRYEVREEVLRKRKAEVFNDYETSKSITDCEQ